MPSYLSFTIEQRRYGVLLEAVRRVERMVEVAPLPDAPSVIAGVIDFHGEMLPVFDLRRRFGLPLRPSLLTDHLLIATARGRTVALAIDTAEEVREVSAAGREAVSSEVVRATTGLEGEPLFLLDFDRLLAEIALPPAAEEFDGADF
ncbi:MAG: chemotaxis protein CheW [Desulfuromonadales bacterium]|nr:chemotaxis protein CheW [Desulfuromonadales bacterium]